MKRAKRTVPPALKHINKRSLILCSSFLLASMFLLACVVPVRRSISQTSFYQLTQKDTPICLEFLDAARALPEYEKLVFGPVYFYEYTYLLGGVKTTLIAPYLAHSVKDVGTAGSADWNFYLDTLTMVWNGSKQAAKETAAIRDLWFSIQVDDNTSLGLSGNLFEIRLGDQYLQSDGGYCVELSAATINSKLAPNKYTTATFSFHGELVNNIKFILSSDAKYNNNIK